ncbi:MAG: glycosyltransferase family 2 protein [Myxococcota bacterium]|nr:glycosyltransferase family 2 protein [Myxococcota bacterium]
MSLGVAIPMYNEEGNCERVIQRCISHLSESNIEFHLAVVNNGSNDGTGLILEDFARRESRLIAIHLSENQGYGGGILAGLNNLILKKPEIIGWTWGDGQVCSTVLPKLYAECKRGADIAKACRIQRQDGYRRRVISKTYAGAIKLIGARSADVNGCPKLFRTEVYRDLHLTSTDWFIDAEAILKAEKQGRSIYQEPVIMEPRAFGKSKVKAQTILEFTKNIALWNLKKH